LDAAFTEPAAIGSSLEAEAGESNGQGKDQSGN